MNMERELRRFHAWDEVGRLYILVESAPNAHDVERKLFRAGQTTFKTLTGAEAIAGPVDGQFRIPKLGVRVSIAKQ